MLMAMKEVVVCDDVVSVRLEWLGWLDQGEVADRNEPRTFR